jgi:hemerythrin-like domain-containing protein
MVPEFRPPLIGSLSAREWRSENGSPTAQALRRRRRAPRKKAPVEHTQPVLQEVLMSKSSSMADSRDMIVLHNMFRREFKAIPGLVIDVPEGARARVAVVADHVAWMVTFLHAHHEGEDQLVWPKLLERIPAEIDSLIHTMEAQHAGLARALNSLDARAAEWRSTAAAEERGAVADAATALLPPIAEHLDLEEKQVLTLIDRYLTDEEWKQVGGSGLKKMSFGQVAVAFGMILTDATSTQVQIMRNTIPRIPWTVFSLLGPRRYAKYAARLRGAGASSRRTTV